MKNLKLNKNGWWLSLIPRGAVMLALGIALFAELHARADERTNLFNPHELTLDLVAQWTVNEPGGIGRIFQTNPRHGTAGISFGSTYFGNRNFGLGFETAIADLNKPGSLLINSTTAILMARLPIEFRGATAHMALAPLLVAGLGRNFSDGLYNTQLGAGLEWRWRGRVALFADARFIFQDRRNDERMVARSGLRLVF